jgi:hypothetical protein
MFRIITKNLKPEQDPQFLLLCDDRGCRNQVNVEFKLAPIDDPEQQKKFKDTQVEFYRDVQADGWALGLDGQFCPACSALADMRMNDMRRVAKEKGESGAERRAEVGSDRAGERETAADGG